LALTIKAIVLAWWASKIWVNPNQKEVMRKRLQPHLYELNISWEFRFFSSFQLLSCCINFSFNANLFEFVAWTLGPKSWYV
jgi:hypothetical protein